MNRWTLTVSPSSAGHDVCSVVSINKHFGSDLLGGNTELHVEVNRTHLGLRDATVVAWPGPLPLFAQFPNDQRLNQAKVGWGEIFLLVRTAINGVCKRSLSFYRYFSEEDAGDVLNMFSTILGGKGFGPDEVTQVDRPLSILYGSQRSVWDKKDLCLASPEFDCWFNNWGRYPNGAPFMVLCPQAFLHHPRPLLDWDCDDMPDTATREIVTLGSVMLHELTHWNAITLKAAPQIPLRVGDYGIALGGVRVPNDGMPPDGYGPYNAMMLNRNRGRGWGTDKQPYQNADNFMWFALET